MKKAKAIELLKLAVPVKALTQQEYSDFVEAVNMGIDALEQPATFDTISRQAAIDAIEKMNIPEDMCVFEILSHIEVEIATLPTAQPEPKEGHWIEGGIYRDVIECYCSECGQIMTTAATVRMNYCPNCGAHMKGERQK